MADQSQAVEQKSGVINQITQDGEIQQPKYTDEERLYLGGLMGVFTNCLTNRESPHSEYDGMTYSEYWDSNEKTANTFLAPRKSGSDVSFKWGIPRNKLFAVLAAINNLNLSGDITAFDKNDFEIARLGESMEDTIARSEELDGDEEKKMLRQYELIKQGDVYVEEIWDEKWMKDKRVIKGGKFTGKVKGVEWMTVMKRMFARPTRNIISGLSIVQGDMRVYDFNAQPCFFTIESKSYETTKEKYGDWDRWQYVPKKVNLIGSQWVNAGEFDNILKYIDIRDGECLIIKYQNASENEFSVIINGVLMTPVGLPLSIVNGFAAYNIANQRLEPIKHDFAGGGSLMKRVRTHAEVFDEMVKLAVLKTQQSYKPPLANMTGRVLSQRIFDAGRITNGISPNQLAPILQGIDRGVTNAELAMIEKIKQATDEDTVAPVFAGQNMGPGQDTATETVNVMRQAKLMLGITIQQASLLEWKLTWLRLFNLLTNWMDSAVDDVNDMRNALVEPFRSVRREKMIPGEGMGTSITIPTKDVHTPDEVYAMENQIKSQTGRPARIMFLNVNEIKKAMITWQVTVRPKEKVSSEMSKLLFRAMLSDAKMFGQDLDMQYLEQLFASTWAVDPAKLFKKPQAQMPQMTGSQSGSVPTASSQVVPPTVKPQIGSSMENATGGGGQAMV